ERQAGRKIGLRQRYDISSTRQAYFDVRRYGVRQRQIGGTAVALKLWPHVPGRRCRYRSIHIRRESKRRRRAATGNPRQVSRVAIGNERAGRDRPDKAGIVARDVIVRERIKMKIVAHGCTLFSLTVPAENPPPDSAVPNSLSDALVSKL